MGISLLTTRAVDLLGVLVACAGLAAGATGASAGTLSDYRLLLLGGGPVKWGTPVLGSGTVVRYALVADEITFDGARNCGAVGPMDGLLAASSVDHSAFMHEVAGAFAAWSAVADIGFVATAPETADILIGAQLKPQGRAFTNVEYAAVDGETRLITRSVICLNPLAGWKVGFDGNLDVYDIRYSLTHEIGHAIGLDHPGVPGEMMDFRYRETFADLQPGDRAGAIDLYGPAMVAGASVLTVRGEDTAEAVATLPAD